MYNSIDDIKEKDGYYIRYREEEIDNLIMWLSESTSESDKFLMKEDLKMLMSWTCEAIYSSESTNEYIEIDN